MKIKPIYEKVLVKRMPEEVQSKGGIYIPDDAREKPQRGEVISVGDGRMLEDGRLIPLFTKQGDVVLFGKYSGTSVYLEGEEYLIMNESDVLGVEVK